MEDSTPSCLSVDVIDVVDVVMVIPRYVPIIVNGFMRRSGLQITPEGERVR